MKTLQDWINEYYPVDAETFVDNLPEDMTKVEKDIALITGESIDAQLFEARRADQLQRHRASK